MPYGLNKFARFAENVWDVNPEGKAEKEIAEEGLSRMEQWMKELGLVMNITALGARESMIPDLVKGTIILKTGYKVLDEKEIASIFRESL
jgi:alcohol dehydrogenase YqhD (iron-dependent ADH family)